MWSRMQHEKLSADFQEYPTISDMSMQRIQQYTAITSWSWHGQVDFSYSGLSDHGFWLLLDCLSQFEACWAWKTWSGNRVLASPRASMYVLEVLQVQQNSDAWKGHCHDTVFAEWLIYIYIYTIPAYFCKTDGRCKQRSWSWHTIGLCSSYEHVLSTKRWDSSSFLHMESAPTHSYMIGYGILKVWCNQFSYVRFPLV